MKQKCYFSGSLTECIAGPQQQWRLQFFSVMKQIDLDMAKHILSSIRDTFSELVQQEVEASQGENRKYI